MTDIRPAEVFSPGEYLRDELEARGWAESEFAEILGRPSQALSEILNGKKEITPATALEIGAALGTSAELWLNLQTKYRLAQLQEETHALTAVERRAALRARLPVRELQRRSWLPDTKDLDELELAACSFLGVTNLAEPPPFRVAAKRANATDDFTPQQTAWIARVISTASERGPLTFDQNGLGELAADLSQRLRSPEALADLGTWLAGVGVHLVIERPLTNSKLDGVATYTPEGTPVIALSTRGDRFDGFVFALLHEAAHLVLGHVKPGEVRVDESIDDLDATGQEADANKRAAKWVLPKEPVFGPGKPKLHEIVVAAQQALVHPSIIIGRLQQTKVLDWKDFRTSIPKVRPFLPELRGSDA